MERKTVSQVQIFVRDALNRASRQASARDFAGAVATLLPIVRRNPDVPMAVEKLREYELSKLATQGAGEKFSAQFAALFKSPVIYIVSSFDPIKAMAMCETSLGHCVANPLILAALENAANAADAPWVAVSALDVSCKLTPGNPQKMRRLAEAMQRNGQALDALKIHQELLKKTPAASLAEQTELRSAMALASIERGNFNDRKSTKANTADEGDAIIQQLLDGTIHDAEQAQLLIDRFTVELKKKDSIDMRRKLADAYMVAGKLEDALREYRYVADKLGVMDPTLDKYIEKAYLMQLRQSIDLLKANPQAYEEPEQQIAELEHEAHDYRWRHTLRRAKNFPNDMQLQFDLGELQFENNMLSDAVKTFERVADNPQKRRASMVYLGRCALLGNDPDHAVKCFEEALKEMFRMDKQKREAMYYLANALESRGDKAKALEYYRQINANMSNYRDVPQRIAGLSDENGNPIE